MLRSKLSNLQPQFSFAGFSWPRHVATLDCGPLAARLADRRAEDFALLGMLACTIVAIVAGVL